MFPQEVADRLLQTMAFHGKTIICGSSVENILLECGTAASVCFLVESGVGII